MPIYTIRDERNRMVGHFHVEECSTLSIDAMLSVEEFAQQICNHARDTGELEGSFNINTEDWELDISKFPDLQKVSKFEFRVYLNKFGLTVDWSIRDGANGQL